VIPFSISPFLLYFFERKSVGWGEKKGKNRKKKRKKRDFERGGEKVGFFFQAWFILGKGKGNREKGGKGGEGREKRERSSKPLPKQNLLLHSIWAKTRKKGGGKGKKKKKKGSLSRERGAEGKEGGERNKNEVTERAHKFSPLEMAVQGKERRKKRKKKRSSLVISWGKKKKGGKKKVGVILLSLFSLESAVGKDRGRNFCGYFLFF